MITEDYVSFETAKLLKEKGFDEPCFAYYSEYWDNWKSFRLWRKFPTRSVPNKGYLNVPTLQMAMKWLRKTHNIIVEPNSVWRDKKWEYQLFVVTPQNAASPYYEHDLYKSYEECVEAGIKYCLENLI